MAKYNKAYKNMNNLGCDNLTLKFMTTEEIYLNVLRELKLYGNVHIFGSARKGKQGINNHDIDIGLITDYKSKIFLKERCLESLENYNRLKNEMGWLPLHFNIIGDFSLEFIVIYSRGVEHLIQFTPKKWRYLIWAQISVIKFMRSLWKRF
jgi:hypothetical protein